jgi:hypothetical protein
MQLIDLENVTPKRYFTPEEANALLPSLKPLVEQLAILSDRLRELTRDLDPRKTGTAEHLLLLNESRDVREQAKLLVERIQSEGVQIKALQPVLLDFPAMLEGREVLLCWRDDEASLTHWHATHNGFRGREPVGEQPTGAWAWFS